MTDEDLIEVLVDTEVGLSPTEGYGPTIEAVRALIAERDDLRADLGDVEEALGDGWATTEATVGQGVQAVVDERDELRAHRDRVVETLEGMKSWVPADRDLLAENARLRSSVARYKEFAESEILDRVSAELGADLRRRLEEGT